MISNVLNSGSALERFFFKNMCFTCVFVFFTIFVFVSVDNLYLISFDTFSSQVPINAHRARGPGEQNFFTTLD